MITFLPFEDYKLCAKALDRQRLCKQRVEVKQIYNAIINGGAWSHHPAVRMWRGYEYDLILYGIAVCNEWISRGYNDSLRLQFLAIFKTLIESDQPSWIGDNRVHSSHRSNLIRKLPSHYRDYLGWIEDDSTPYFWP